MFLSQSAHETTGCSHLLESVSSITCVMYAPISTSNPFLTQTNDCRSMEPWRFFFSLSPFFPFFFFPFQRPRSRRTTVAFARSASRGIERSIYIGLTIDSTPPRPPFAIRLLPPPDRNALT